jgi:alpha-methylacyl-CoA racemase
VGPLQGIKVIEVAGIGPSPFGAMMLADMGAQVLRIDRIGPTPLEHPGSDPLLRGRLRAAIDLKRPQGIECLLELCERADALIEGFRPGVMERLGLGPETCLARNPRLVYGRMTGWGQTGPLSQTAGHDINYVALSGALHAIGRAGDKPVVPLSLVGDFGGGGMLLAFGIVCALLETQRSGRGQIVDAAMLDGASLLMTMFFGLRGAGAYREERGSNLFDGGWPAYDTYETADGQHLALGALEPEFYAELLRKLELEPASLPPRMKRERWPELRERLARVFKTKSRAAWCELLEGSDACVSPVLSMTEAAAHPQVQARQTLVSLDGVLQPAPAPRYSRTEPLLPTAPSRPGADTDEALARWGFSAARIAALRAAGAIGGGSAE